MLLTTQYLEEADRLAGQIVIINAGRVTAQGTPDDLKNSLGSRVDVVLADGAGTDGASVGVGVAGSGALATAETVLRGITGNQPRVDPERRRLTAAIAAGAVTLPELVRRLDAAGVEAEDVSIRRPTLDEVFLAETERPETAENGGGGMIGVVTDGAAAAERQLTRLRHDPSAITLTLGAPVVLVIIFGYIFGSAIAVPGGGGYREFLLPGLFATTAANIAAVHGRDGQGQQPGRGGPLPVTADRADWRCRSARRRRPRSTVLGASS